MLPTLEISIKQKQLRRLDLQAEFKLNGDYKIIKEEYIDLIPSCFTLGASDEGRDVAKEVEVEFDYLFPEVMLTLLHDVYVSRSGGVRIGKTKFISETIEAGIDVNFDVPLSAYEPIDTCTAASKFGNFNHAIFTMESLPLMLLSQMDLQAAQAPRPLHFERDYCGEAFVTEHLRLIAALGLFGDHFDRDVHAARAFVPTASRRDGSFRATALSQAVAAKIRSVVATPEGGVLPRRIYISRRYASSRVPRHIDALEWIAAARGYTPVHLEQMTALDQVALFASCEAIMAEHGAGLANLQYASPGCRVLELFPSAMYGKWVFRLAAHCAGAVYSTGSFPVEDGWVYNRDDVDIDPYLFNHCLDHLDGI